MALDLRSPLRGRYVQPDEPFGGYNPNRLVDVNIFAGIGANIAWKKQRGQPD